MKKSYLLLFLSIFFFSFVSSHSYALSNGSSKLKRRINISGDLSAVNQRSLPATDPIQVFQDDSSLQVNFTSVLGTIAIIIFDEFENVVYQQSVNTSAVQQMFIDISSFSSGEYTIEFVNSQNQYLEGNFEI